MPMDSFSSEGILRRLIRLPYLPLYVGVLNAAVELDVFRTLPSVRASGSFQRREGGMKITRGISWTPFTVLDLFGKGMECTATAGKRTVIL